MPNQVVWPRMNVFNEDGEATVLKRGDLLPDGVDAKQVEDLMVIGAVRPVEYAPERPQDPEDESADDEPEDTPALLHKPSPDDSKAAWVDYATDERNPRRIERSAANSMSKTALMDRFKE